MLLAFDDEAAFATCLAAAIGVPLAIIERHRFPDGETRLRLPAHLPPAVVLLRGLQDPNAKLTELLLAAAGARELGAQQLTLVSPYLAYMRQDLAFTPGEVVSQRHIGRLLAAAFDAVVTVDPHLHRVSTLDEVVPGRRGVALSAAVLLGGLVAAQVPGALLLAPDEEAGQWVRAAAAAHGLDHAVCRKTRHGDRDVVVSMPSLDDPASSAAADLSGRHVVLLDDVASTGRTLAAAAAAALRHGALQVDVAVSHALFIGDALSQVHAAGVGRVWSSDCIAHPTNTVSVVPLIAAALQALDRPL
ncbi:MAG: ribose-phosphate diphosphokinase [Rubrivivax sp.]